jgi:hypothetical protein
MDDIVKQAMAKWPAVPAVYGWLGLDNRGNWLIKGDRISNPVVTAFINRNYEHDARGRWYFQNGPQRVFAALEYTPLVYRLPWNAESEASLRIAAHTGAAVATVTGAWIDDAGAVVLDTELGPGVMDDRDLERLLPCFTNERGEPLPEEAIGSAIERLQSCGSASLSFRYGDRIVPVTGITARDVPGQLGFVQRPAQPNGEEVCC